MPDDAMLELVSIGEPVRNGRPGRRRIRWLVPIAVAAVLVTVFAVIAMVGRSSRHPKATTGAPGSSTALGWWASFPVDASPRPLVLTGSAIIDPAGGFPVDDSKLAYVSGSFRLTTALPAGPVTVHGQRIGSAEDALAELRKAGSPGPPVSTPPLAITAVRLDTATFSTDRGPRTLPAWSFRFAGVAEPGRVLAVPAADRWPHPGMPTGSSGPETGATLSADASLATLSFVGMAAGTGPCQANYAADVTQSSTAVSVSVRELANPNNRNVQCDAVGFRRALTVTLQPPLGNRVLIDAHGTPLPDSDPLPFQPKTR
jgi:hypothetical protein